jgi:hypothetical protein
MSMQSRVEAFRVGASTADRASAKLSAMLPRAIDHPSRRSRDASRATDAAP